MPVTFQCPTCGRTTQAPDELAGRQAKCPHCLTVIQVPRPDEAVEDVPLAVAAPREPAVPGAEPAPTVSAAGEIQRRPCPKCGEMIVATAAKCRFCGEIFDPTLRRNRREAKDEGLETGDYFLALLPCFSVIGCIVGIVYMIQGRSKGGRMLALSIGMTILWSCISGMAGALQDRNRARRFSEHRPANMWDDATGGLVATKYAKQTK